MSGILYETAEWHNGMPLGILLHTGKHLLFHFRRSRLMDSMSMLESARY